jgi:hypothetical protein
MLDSSESGAVAHLFSSMARKRRDDPARRELHEEVPGQADRLKRIRRALQFETSTAFAAFLDIDSSRYNAFENGRPLSRDVAFRLVRKIPGLSLDWIYFGKADGLPIELARRLGLFDPPGKATT